LELKLMITQNAFFTSNRIVILVESSTGTGITLVFTGIFTVYV